eukprot:3786399-Alexandrium_andersonii.AAC.1
MEESFLLPLEVRSPLPWPWPARPSCWRVRSRASSSTASSSTATAATTSRAWATWSTTSSTTPTSASPVARRTPTSSSTVFSTASCSACCRPSTSPRLFFCQALLYSQPARRCACLNAPDSTVAALLRVAVARARR